MSSYGIGRFGATPFVKLCFRVKNVQFRSEQRKFSTCLKAKTKHLANSKWDEAMKPSFVECLRGTCWAACGYLRFLGLLVVSLTDAFLTWSLTFGGHPPLSWCSIGSSEFDILYKTLVFWIHDAFMLLIAYSVKWKSFKY